MRKERDLSATEVAERFSTGKNIPVSATTAARVLRRTGLSKLGRLHGQVAGGHRLSRACSGGDYRTLDLRLRVLCIDFGGLYLLAGGLARFGFDAILRRAACQTLRM